MSPCPPVQQLELLIDDGLTDPEERTLIAHVDACTDCQQRLEQLTRAADLPSGERRDSPDAEPSTVLVERWIQTPPERTGEAGTSALKCWPQVRGYEILGELGRGGMGVVYKARQLGLNRLVALKMILEGPHAGATQLARFRREAEAVARLQHPHIVQIHEIGEQDGRPFFSMELVAGGSLADHLDGRPLNPGAAAALVETLGRAVHAAHQQGIIHRDLKPANVLLHVENGRLQNEAGQSAILNLQAAIPKITDFGLAKDVTGRVPRGVARTGSGTILGSPSYMAPEQAQAKPAAVGLGADVYSLGAILYELVTGRPPFRAETSLETVLQVLHEEPVPPRRLQPKLPRDLETICQTCLRKEAQRRYPSALALAEDLRRFLSGEPIRARPTGALERGLKWARRRPALAALLAVGVVACVVLVVADQRSKAQLREALQQATTQRQRADANYELVDIQRRRAEAVTLEALNLIVAFANELGQNGKTAEAVDLLTRGIGKVETLLQGELYPRQLLGEALWTMYGIRAQFYMFMERYPEARADWERLPEDYASPVADVYRSLLAVTLAKLGEHREATNRAQVLAQKAGLSGSTFYSLAQAYSVSILAVRQDPKPSSAEKDQLTEHYGTRAVALLHRARAAQFFAEPSKLEELRTDTDFNRLRSRADFQKLLAELEAEAVTSKPKTLSGSK